MNTEKGSYEKTFWYPTHYRGTWAESVAICKSFNMQLITLDSDAEARHFLSLFIDNSPLFDQFTHLGAVGSIPRTLTEWFWVENTQKVNFTLVFGSGLPDNYGGNEVCLSLGYVSNTFYFNDLKCYESYSSKFVCQTISYEPLSKF